MMRMLSNKKNVKLVSVAVSAIFIVGIAGLAYMQMNTTAMASPQSNIGVVDLAKAVPESSPLMDSARKEMAQYAQDLQAQFEKESANMDNQQKQQLFMEFQQKMQAKELELQTKMENEVKESIKSVADTKGLTIVLNKNAVLYGGTDITDSVAKKVETIKAPTQNADSAKSDAKK